MLFFCSVHRSSQGARSHRSTNCSSRIPGHAERHCQRRRRWSDVAPWPAAAAVLHPAAQQRTGRPKLVLQPACSCNTRRHTALRPSLQNAHNCARGSRGDSLAISIDGSFRGNKQEDFPAGTPTVCRQLISAERVKTRAIEKLACRITLSGRLCCRAKPCDADVELLTETGAYKAAAGHLAEHNGTQVRASHDDVANAHAGLPLHPARLPRLCRAIDASHHLRRQLQRHALRRRSSVTLGPFLCHMLVEPRALCSASMPKTEPDRQCPRTLAKAVLKELAIVCCSADL